MQRFSKYEMRAINDAIDLNLHLHGKINFPTSLSFVSDSWHILQDFDDNNRSLDERWLREGCDDDFV